MRHHAVEADKRVKAKHYSWKDYVKTYLVLIVLAAGQGMILDTYMGITSTPPAIIAGMLGYWAIVTAIYVFVTTRQKISAFDKPMRRLSKAAKKVAEGTLPFVWSLCIEQSVMIMLM